MILDYHHLPICAIMLLFFAAFGYADITPPAARVQIRKAFSQSFDKRFFRVLLSVIRKRYEKIPTVKIRFATESFFALPDIAHFTSEILFDEVFDIGQFDTVIVDKFIFDILLLFFVGCNIAFYRFVKEKIEQCYKFRTFAFSCSSFKSFYRFAGDIMTAVVVYLIFARKRILCSVE